PPLRLRRGARAPPPQRARRERQGRAGARLARCGVAARRRPAGHALAASRHASWHGSAMTHGHLVLIAGALLTAGLAASLLEGLLLGSIVAATDGAAVFALLRGTALKRSLVRTLEGEAGMNDPVAVLLVVGFIDWIRLPHYGLGDMAWLFVRQLSIGGALGLAVGLLAVQAFERAR